MPSCYNESVYYKSYRNKLNTILKKSEKQLYSDFLAANKSNIKKTWQIMKNIVNKNKMKRLIPNSNFQMAVSQKINCLSVTNSMISS